MWTFMNRASTPGPLILAFVAAEALRPADQPDVLPAQATQSDTVVAAGDHRTHPQEAS